MKILVDGEAIAESTTYSEFSTVIVDWFPRAGPIEEILPGEDLPKECA